MTGGVPPAAVGTQPIGQISEVADSVYQLKLPVPFPLEFVSSYLVAGGDGWTVIDPGFDYPPAREAWEAGAAEVGLDLYSGVSRIVVTHLHPDHIGLAYWLQELSGAPVLMLSGEIESARQVWDPRQDNAAFVGFLARNGMERQTAETGRLGVRLPERIEELHPGDRVHLGDYGARVIQTPGHSDFHFVLHDESRRLLFAGDHVLLRVTPNIGLWPYTAPRPLQRYLDSLEGLRGLDAGLVLPGHGPPFYDLDGRIDELLRHHAERLSVMRSALDGGTATAFDVARRVFSGDLDDHQLRFALVETLAHLEYLVDDGRAERFDGNIISYRAM